MQPPTVSDAIRVCLVNIGVQGRMLFQYQKLKSKWISPHERTVQYSCMDLRVAGLIPGTTG